jgi:hypothetical protein
MGVRPRIFVAQVKLRRRLYNVHAIILQRPQWYSLDLRQRKWFGVISRLTNPLRDDPARGHNSQSERYYSMSESIVQEGQNLYGNSSARGVLELPANFKKVCESRGRVWSEGPGRKN